MKDNQIAISVIVPAYNLEKYIGDCIDSVLNQSLKNVELILVDDCSTDHTKEVIKEYIECKTSIDIILLENDKNEDAGYSRNRGLDIARGEYLLFLDGDDMLEPNALERLYSVCRETKADIVNCDYQVFDNKTHEIIKSNSPVDVLIEPMKVFRLSDMSDCAFQFFHEVAWDKVFRRVFIQENEIRFQCQSNANDQFFVYAALLKAERIVKISDCLLNYRTNRENQLSTSGNISRNPRCIFRATKATLDYIEKSGLYDLYQKSFLTYTVERLIFSLKKVDSTEAEKLITFYKEEGFEALKMLGCSMADFDIPYFFFMYSWLTYIKSAKELEKTKDWKLWNNEGKCEQLFKKLIKEKKIVLWGAGINGKKFLEKAHFHKIDINRVVDMDKSKIGQVICGHMIKGYDEIENGDLIIVLNPKHITSIRSAMIQQKKKVKMLDARAYLCFDIDYEQAEFEVV